LDEILARVEVVVEAAGLGLGRRCDIGQPGAGVAVLAELSRGRVEIRWRVAFAFERDLLAGLD
jgi:hypothetical protein